MEIDRLFGVPAHPFLVHLPVVLVPLAAIAAVAIALRPSWRRQWGWWVVGLTVAGLVATQFAYGSGERFRTRFDPTSAIRRHADAADFARPAIALFAAVVIAFVWGGSHLDSRSSSNGAATRSNGAIALAALTVITGVVATAALVRTGHLGATAVWKNVVEQQP